MMIYSDHQKSVKQKQLRLSFCKVLAVFTLSTELIGKRE